MKINKTDVLLSFTVFGFIVAIKNVEGSLSAERDLTLTASQKNTLDKFKTVAESLVKDDYKKKEVYLIKWLRGANFNLKSATQKLKADIIWRNKLRMDTIHDEDWSEFRSLYEYNVEGVDKSGEPVLIADMGNWDFRKAMVSGQRDRLERYIYKMLDDANVQLRKRQTEGRHVTRSIVVINLDGYNAVQHGCIPCISFYLILAGALDAHFPELFDEVIIFNAPSIFEVVLNIVKPALPSELQKSIVIFGTGKREWQTYLREMIDDNELPYQLGGTKVFDFSPY